jgi:hypothetical protein
MRPLVAQHASSAASLHSPGHFIVHHTPCLISTKSTIWIIPLMDIVSDPETCNEQNGGVKFGNACVVVRVLSPPSVSAHSCSDVHQVLCVPEVLALFLGLTNCLTLIFPKTHSSITPPVDLNRNPYLAPSLSEVICPAAGADFLLFALFFFFISGVGLPLFGTAGVLEPLETPDAELIDPTLDNIGVAGRACRFLLGVSPGTGGSHLRLCAWFAIIGCMSPGNKKFYSVFKEF